MKNIREVYPPYSTDDTGYEYISFSDYQPLLESFEYPIIYQVDDNDYQGDSRIIFSDQNRYGLLIFGWGSCSGCDALKACQSYNNVENLRQNLFNSIQWFKSAVELLNYLNIHDWEGDYSWYAEETRSFVHEAKQIISNLLQAQCTILTILDALCQNLR